CTADRFRGQPAAPAKFPQRPALSQAGPARHPTAALQPGNGRGAAGETARLAQTFTLQLLPEITGAGSRMAYPKMERYMPVWQRKHYADRFWITHLRMD